MERAFSALASAVRVPSPLGWAGMKGAFGAPRFGGVAAPTQATKPEMSKLQSGDTVPATFLKRALVAFH